MAPSCDPEPITEKKKSFTTALVLIPSIEIQLLLQQLSGTVQKPSSPALCRTLYEKTKQTSIIFKICPISQAGENVCVMSKIAKEVSEITDTLRNVRKKLWQKPSKVTKPAALPGSQQKEIKPFCSQLRPFSPQA